MTTDISHFVLHMPDSLRMTDEQLLQFCAVNRELRIERTTEGDLIIMPLAGGGKQSSECRYCLSVEHLDKTGWHRIRNRQCWIHSPEWSHTLPGTSWNISAPIL
jgi:Uma2 family endonuclease